MNTTLDFDNPEVAAAINPSAYGYHHGPIPNNNIGWRPTIDPKEAITTELNESPPVPPERMSGVNGLVCDIAVNGTQMCGTCCASQMALRRHIRQAHPGALENPSKANTGFEEKIAGENALKHWVLYLGWRQARYLHEPKNKISHESPIWRYADVCEMLASIDKGFKDKFGDTFHRQDAMSAPVTPQKRKNAAPATPKKPKNAAPAKTRSSSRRGRGKRMSSAHAKNSTLSDEVVDPNNDLDGEGADA